MLGLWHKDQVVGCVWVGIVFVFGLDWFEAAELVLVHLWGGGGLGEKLVML